MFCTTPVTALLTPEEAKEGSKVFGLPLLAFIASTPFRKIQEEEGEQVMRHQGGSIIVTERRT